jgi:hypothetical protein
MRHRPVQAHIFLAVVIGACWIIGAAILFVQCST